MSKFIVTFLFSMFSLSLFAQPFEIKSSEMELMNSYASIERVLTLDNKFTSGRINLVELDNGGSTDIGSAVYPSTLLLTYYQDGEEHNIRAVFVLGAIYSLKSATITGKVISAKVELRSEETLKITTTVLKIDISDLIEKAIDPVITVEGFDDQILKAKVTISEML